MGAGNLSFFIFFFLPLISRSSELSSICEATGQILPLPVNGNP